MYVQTEKLVGMKISLNMRGYMKQLLISLEKRQELTKESHKQVKELLENPDIQLDKYFSSFEELHEAKSAFINLSSAHLPHKEDGIIALLELFSNCSCIEE
jgi:hypothetical protein